MKKYVVVKISSKRYWLTKGSNKIMLPVLHLLKMLVRVNILKKKC